MSEGWGAHFLCQKKRKYPHSGNFYFFDSKPEELVCPWCQDGTLMKRTRILDMGKTSGKLIAAARRRAQLVNPASKAAF